MTITYETFNSSMLKERIKLIVADLDGTLLDETHQLADITRQTVTELVEQGYQFMIATGRHYQDVYLIARQLGVDMCLITSNGARVHNADGEILFANTMPQDLVAEVLRISQGFGAHRNLYQEDLWLVEEPHEELLAIHHASGFTYQIVDFASLNLDRIDKIYFTAEHECLLELEARLSASLSKQLTITFTSPEYLEVMNLGVSKGHALQMILQQKQLAAEQVMAFGDGMNDCHMLELAGHGVVMGNASETVKSKLQDLPQARPNSEYGVAQYIRDSLL